MLYIMLKIFLFLCLFGACTTFFYYLKSNQILGRKLKEVHVMLDEASVKRTRAWKHNIGIERPMSFWEKVLEKPHQRFTYSGIANKFPGVTVEIWLLMVMLSAAVVYMLSFAILKNLLHALLVMSAYVAVLALLESFLVIRNYKAVDDELLKFLNLLSNFSIANGEITSVFLQISKFLQEPLRTELEECYYEAHTSGDSKAALEVLEAKIEHPLFKEIVRNLIICIDYSANYKEVVSNSRKIVLDEQRARRERKAVANEAILNVLIISIMLFISLNIVDRLVKVSIWVTLLQTTFGQISLAAVGLIYLIFAWKIWTVDR